ncbi:MAG: OmpA family protein [Planctomycetia bacterium]|nr:OmpA family protein [Planctomycetia bacterium]
MSFAIRILVAGGIGLLALSQTACNMVPRYQLAQAQNRTRQLHEQNRGLLAQIQSLQQQIAGLNARDQTLQSRLDNLLAERNQLGTTRSPLSDATNRQFADLEKRYPGFEFDPQTGVSKFSNDILFESGSDELRADAGPLLSEFARILNTGEASQLNVLVAGHTDDQPVKKASTKSRHPDNWYLSAHRSINVVHELHKHGITNSRMGVAGYAEYQPRVARTSNDARRQNRRVEIFVLAPGASTAGWDPGTVKK